MAGGLLGSNRVGVAPSTVMKNSVSLSASVESTGCSEKYSFRVAVTVAVPNPAKRNPNEPPAAAAAAADAPASVTGSGGANDTFWMVASGRAGSLLPAGPVLTANVWKTAFLTANDGPVTMNSPRPAGGIRT